MKPIPRFPPRQKRSDGTFGCRGCGKDIPKDRKTWCSHKCHLQFDPVFVKPIVRNRCKEKCEMCGLDCSRPAQREHHNQMPSAPSYQDCELGFPYDFKTHYTHPKYLAYLERKKAWKAESPVGEFDHIIPHSEGGKFTPENIRFLCVLCHKARTKLWRREKAAQAIIPNK